MHTGEGEETMRKGQDRRQETMSKEVDCATEEVAVVLKLH